MIHIKEFIITSEEPSTTTVGWLKPTNSGKYLVLLHGANGWKPVTDSALIKEVYDDDGNSLDTILNQLKESANQTKEELQQSIDKLGQEVKQNTEGINTVQESLDSLTESITNLHNTVDALQGSISSLENNITSIGTDITSLDERVTTLEEELGKNVQYTLECSTVGESVVSIDGEDVTIPAGKTINGRCTNIDFPTGSDNLKSIYIKGDVEFNLSPQDESEEEENNVLESLTIVYSNDFERSYNQFCHGFDSLKTVSITGSCPTSLDRTFAECREVTDFDINSINTENVTTMYRLFRHCNSIETLNLSNWITSNVTTMEQTFAYLYALKSLNIKFDTSNVTAMNGMFRDNNVIETLDLSTFNTSKVTEFNAMFRECYALTNLYLGDNWDMGAANTITNMFYDCQSLTNVTGTISNIMLDIDLSYAPLTRESVLVFINGLYDYSEESGHVVHNITISQTTSNSLTSEDRAIITNKGWSISSHL